MSKHRRSAAAAEAAEALLARLGPSRSGTSGGWVPQRPEPGAGAPREPSPRAGVAGAAEGRGSAWAAAPGRVRWAPTRRAATGLGVVLLLAVLVTLLMVWRAQPSAEAAPRVHRLTPATSVSTLPAPSPAASTAESAPSEVVVHVVGAVRRPGLVHLPAGSRVADAVEAAGGATGRARLASVNLARVLVDGEQLVVQSRGGPALVGAPGAAGGAVPPGGASAAGGPTSPVDLNTATLEELDGLPGIGPVLAQRILDWRTANGRFSTVDELSEVSGIGEATLSDLRPLVRV